MGAHIGHYDQQAAEAQPSTGGHAAMCLCSLSKIEE